MNFNELSTYNLADAVKFHNRLNPGLWNSDETLRPEVRDKLLEIAADFQEFLGVSDLEVEDITISGSNAAYSYTPHSDIDLHLVVRKPESHDQVYQELFNAKKYQYNDEHDIRIRGADVELYVQDADETPVSLGEYSIKNSEWIQVPRRKRAAIDQSIVKHKYEDLKARIESALREDDADRIGALIAKIKAMRQTGLDQHGEFGPENLAFKMLRTQGLIKQLYAAKAAAKDRELSLKELAKPRQPVRYGFTESSSPNGVSPETKMFLSEVESENAVRDFIAQTVKKLNIRRVPKIQLHRDDAWSQDNRSFGQFVPETNELHVSLVGRHLLDILRTTAHELAHCRQNEINPLPAEAGETGSKWENQANATAGVLMRDFAEANPELFDRAAMLESSGYIPTAAQKNDPRFVMALSPDVRPGATGKEANKMALKTDAQGRPALLIRDLKNALREFKESGRMPQLSKGPGKYRDLNEPLGPESPPKMPAGTIKVDVSDTQDWYQLGQDISDLDHADKSHYNQGPPHTVLAFGSEELENMYSHKLKRLGLPTHDLDEPGEEDLDEELTEAQLMEIKMTGKNLRAEAAKTGAQAGMEFEMIVPNVETDVEPEMEPDMDQDQRTRSFSDIRDFFHDGDYNGRRQVDNLMEELSGEYEEWKQEQTAEQWDRDGVDYMRDFIEVNELFDRDEALPQARDEVMDANPDLPQESEDFQKLLSARLDQLQEEFVLESFEDKGRVYNDAFETFAEEQNEEYDERSFLDDRYQTMSDIQRNFDIDWPYYYNINDGQDGDLDIDQVADEFGSYMGKPVNASKQYHGGRREAGTYVVEPDGSLEGDNPGDGGLEFVSPPMPIDEMISDLNKVKAWAGEFGCYTNDSTGLHINISVPNYSIDKLDYVKLAILMGDEYILDLFGRSGNTYAKSAMGKIKTALKQKPEAAAQIMDLMKQGLDGAATKAIHTGITDKYTSINTKTGYIEFRSPGGDWLDSNFANIENTLLRFTVALSAAINPEAYRKEYLTKLYKLLSEGMADKSDVNIIQLFSNYSAGELDKAALIRQVRAKQLARDVSKGKATGKMWWKVSNPSNSFASIEVVADNAEEAIASAILPGNYPDWARVKNTLKATPIRPYEAPKAQSKQGNWGIWLDGAERFTRIPRTEPGGDGQALRRFDSESAATTWLADYRARNPGVRTDISIREIPADYQWPPADAAATTQPQEYEVFDRDTGATVDTFTASNDGDVARGINNYRTMGPHNLTPEQAEQRYGLRRAGSTPIARTSQTPGVPQGGNTGDWGVWVPALERYATIGNAGARRFETEADAQAWIQDYNTRHSGNDLGLVAREVSAAQPAFQEPNAARGDLNPRGPGPWEIYRISDNSSVRNLTHTDRQMAGQEARMALGMRGEAPELYAVRTRQSDAAQGGVVDVAGETPAAAPQAQQEWTGEWLVLDPNGRELHRFSGIGNVQADANRHAINWLRAHPGAMQAGVTVVPEMQ